MALIYRAIFQVEDPGSSFTERAGDRVQDWLRFKFRDDGLELPDEGTTTIDPYGIEVGRQQRSSDECRVARLSVYEPHREDGVLQVKTTLTAISDGEKKSWAWVDLERWAPHQVAPTWIPVTPGIVISLLEKEEAYRGDLRLSRGCRLVTADEGELLASLVLDSKRELPIVVVSHRNDEEHAIEQAQSRATQIARRVRASLPRGFWEQGLLQLSPKRCTRLSVMWMDVHSGRGPACTSRASEGNGTSRADTVLSRFASLREGGRISRRYSLRPRFCDER